MLTPILEKLILSGKASYNTFVVGGSEKHILNVENDRFIIITDLLYFHEVNLNSKARGCTLEELNELKNNPYTYKGYKGGDDAFTLIQKMGVQ